MPVPVPRNDAHALAESVGLSGNRKYLSERFACYVIIIPHAESDRRRSFRDKTETMLSIRTHLRIEGIRGPPLHHTLLASNTHDQSENFADFQKCNHRILDPSSVFLGPRDCCKTGARRKGLDTSPFVLFSYLHHLGAPATLLSIYPRWRSKTGKRAGGSGAACC